MMTAYHIQGLGPRRSAQGMYRHAILVAITCHFSADFSESVLKTGSGGHGAHGSGEVHQTTLFCFVFVLFLFGGGDS